MKVKFKEPITTDTGVIYPAGHVVECDTLVNLRNGKTQLTQLGVVHAGLPPVAEVIMEVGVRDLHKLEVTLEYPA